ncbi:putative lipid II flippase FtsW [Faucicola boevrei]|uniref:putative lipid II flippase FtsW n=1 Tax=Faucicola boevrei TaxID=346665 RepID=UPI0003A3FF97|nr:putative lipid II flippase FtsW [Moraxella boevrei]
MPIRSSSFSHLASPTAKEKRWLPSLSSVLISCVGMIMVMSLLMVTSASISFAELNNMYPLKFFINQLSYMMIGIIFGFIVYCVPLRTIFRTNTSFFVLLGCLAMIIYTVIFGSVINGSRRWIEIGSINFQPAELAKLAMILFTADFLVRRVDEVRYQATGFIRLCGVAFFMILAIMLQPDFGSVVIIIGCMGAMIFVAGLPMRLVMILLGSVSVGVVLAILTAGYRLKRVTSFIDPFDDLRDSDYQLGRSIVAFARGEWTGVGYGESIQKLAHLPEAHTDFLLAITGEELGLVGVVFLLSLQILLIWVVMKISYDTLKRRQSRLSYFAFGVGVLFFGQAFVNAGMTLGILPTKGLTMPFFSYGGSSMVVNLIIIGILLRIIKDSPKISPTEARYY